MSDLHVVLGGAGVTGAGVIKELKAKNLPIRAVERRKNVEGVETVHADLTNQEQASRAIAGASHVYICVGIEYNAKIWAEQWPKLMRAVIQAAADNQAKLIFLDNVYMYGPAPLPTPFDEATSQVPDSKKGRARKLTADLLLAAHQAGKVKAVIGRSADFYGPGFTNSALYIKFLQNIINNKNPQIIGAKNAKHTYAYTEDNGRALVQLALDDSTYGEVWHLPVGPTVTPVELTALFNKLTGHQTKPTFLPKPLLTGLSLFIPQLRELKEVLYQFNQDYLMSDKKFRTKYPNFKVTPYEVGLAATIRSFKEPK